MARKATKPKAPKKASPAGSAAAADSALQVYVRMYRALDAERSYQGMLGDCFLIRLVQDGSAAHILIDCGLLMGSVKAAERMQAIAEDIVRETGAVLDLLVVTHEHWDHISGFSQAQGIFLNPDRLHIANLWMAWTEKDGDPQATRLRARFDKTGVALAALAERADSAGMQGVDKGGTVRSLQGFQGEPDTGGKRLQGRDIMEALKRVATQRTFLEPGTVLPTPTAAPGRQSLRAYVFGPPRDETLLFKDKPSSGPARETYFDSDSLSDAILHAVEGRDPTLTANVPFAPQYCMIKATDVSQAADPGGVGDDKQMIIDRGWIHDHYYGVPKGSRERAEVLQRRRIDDDWLGAAGSLALKLDSDTNNTSLVLAFDLPDGSAMLFAADAQVGNWESWHERSYTDETGKVHSAEQILNRTRFYKVGHHGSHNATLDAKGLAMMTRDDLVAAIPTDEEFGKKQGGSWQMPNPRVKEALMKRTSGRIMRNDRHYDPASRAADPELNQVAQGFFDQLTETDLYLEYRVL